MEPPWASGPVSQFTEEQTEVPPEDSWPPAPSFAGSSQCLPVWVTFPKGLSFLLVGVCELSGWKSDFHEVPSFGNGIRTDQRSHTGPVVLGGAGGA